VDLMSSTRETTALQRSYVKADDSAAAQLRQRMGLERGHAYPGVTLRVT